MAPPDTTAARDPAADAAPAGNPFDLDDDRAYRRWRDWKLARHPQRVEDLIVDVRDPRQLDATERAALLDRIVRANMALYRSPVLAEDRELPRRLGAQLGLQRLDAHWLADEDGIASIAVHGADTQPGAADDRGAFIPYTDRPIRWHTDGYYHPAGRRIRGMILHCVRPARSGGVNRLLDHEMAYIALRDTAPGHVRALMRDDAMTIPERTDTDGVARAAQTGPVFAVDRQDGGLHMRYTARTRSIAWKEDAAMQAARACLEALLASDLKWIFTIRMEAGMGLAGHNVLHDRSGFDDDPAQPRLLYRARFLDRVQAPAAGPAP